MYKAADVPMVIISTMTQEDISWGDTDPVALPAETKGSFAPHGEGLRCLGRGHDPSAPTTTTAALAGRITGMVHLHGRARPVGKRRPQAAVANHPTRRTH